MCLACNPSVLMTVSMRIFRSMHRNRTRLSVETRSQRLNSCKNLFTPSFVVSSSLPDCVSISYK